MKIIKNLKHIYHFTTLQTGFNALNKIDNMDELQQQLSKNKESIQSIKLLLKEDTFLSEKIHQDPNLTSQINVMVNINNYIYLFSNQEFEDAFHFSYGLFNTASNNFEKSYFLNSAIDALSQIKTQYMKEDRWLAYNSRFHQVETSLLQSIDSVEKVEVTPNGISLSSFYNGTKIGAAYLHFLEHNISLAEEYLQQQSQEFGNQKTLEHENSTSHLFWYRNSINQEKKAEFIQFINTTLSSDVSTKVQSTSKPSSI